MLTETIKIEKMVSRRCTVEILYPAFSHHTRLTTCVDIVSKCLIENGCNCIQLLIINVYQWH